MAISSLGLEGKDRFLHLLNLVLPFLPARAECCKRMRQMRTVTVCTAHMHMACIEAIPNRAQQRSCKTFRHAALLVRCPLFRWTSASTSSLLKRNSDHPSAVIDAALADCRTFRASRRMRCLRGAH